MAFPEWDARTRVNTIQNHFLEKLCFTAVFVHSPNHARQKLVEDCQETTGLRQADGLDFN
jgi:hypothetical protein